jgi:glycosyltransferase involved in cell wall biosynthesis
MSPPRRILMTADTVGGVWTYALDLAAGLAASGVETTLAVLGPEPSADQVRDAETIPGLRLISTGLPLDWTATEPMAIGKAGAFISRVAHEVGADLVHLNSPALAGNDGFSVPVLGACHSCVATWWSAVKEGPMPSDFLWRTQAVGRGLLACDALIAPTASFATATARVYEVPPPFVVHNGRRFAGCQPQRREQLVFTSGRLWDEGKNASVLDEVAGVIGAPIYAAGPLTGPTGGRFEPLHLAAMGRLRSDEVAQWLGRASVYVSSARYEPFGLGVLEAAQASCALVLSDISTFRELWDGAAVFVEPDQPAAFAAAIERLLADEGEARRLAALAQAGAARFTVEAMSAGVLEVYRHMTGAVATAPRREALA